ncbi:MAG: HD domain-containing protein [Candidatus Portnoybacteria bacterium]|nr:HD domain-containing protein [Candidatus Portnoybacteria bacterium]
MEHSLYKKAEQFMIDVFTKAGDEIGIKHHQRTVYWIKELKPDANESLLISGILHDIERGINGDWKASSMDPEALKKHQDLSALEAEKFLITQTNDTNLINSIKELISRHEEGGNEEQNILCDADSLVYFENVALRHARTYKEKGKTKEEMEKKFEYIFNRINTGKAKQIAQKWYSEALEELNHE